MSNSKLIAQAALLEELLDGNRRFVEGALPAATPAELMERRHTLAAGQSPALTVLTCSDSRIDPNLVFLKGPGEMFVVRLAGNYASEDALCSIAYAVEQLSTRLIVVLGHEGCGAVKAVYEAIETGEALPPHLRAIDRGMRGAIEPVVAAEGNMIDAAIANVTATVERIRTTDGLRRFLTDRPVAVVGAIYHLASGQVEMLSCTA